MYDDDGAGNASIARTSTTDYDQAGRSVKSTDALGRTSIPTYDNGGRVTQSTLFDRSGVALSTSQTHYDALGRVDYTTDASNHVKRMRYDRLGRLDSVIQATRGIPQADGLGQYDLVTSFSYDEVGHKIAQQDASGHITTFGYDVRGRMVWRRLPLGQIETMVYDDGGQLDSSTDFRGYTTTFRYDERGRLTSKVPDNALVLKGEQVLSYSYPNENTRIAYRGASATTQNYDPQRGWLNSVSGPNGTVSYGYNVEGQKLSMSSPSSTTRYGYDAMGRLSAISDQPTGAAAATNIAAYRFDAVGNMASMTRGNGVVTRYAYDEQNRLADLVNANGQLELSRFHYTLRDDGKRTGLDERLVNADAGRVSTRSIGYSYDDAGKLTSESGQDGLGVAYANSWTYDAVGNRVAATTQKAASAGATTWAHTTSVSAAFNENDQLTSSSSVVDGAAALVQNYGYDANGAEKTVASASGLSTNGWDFEGKLTQTALSDANGGASGGSINSFDAQGDRLARVADVGKASQKTTNYLVDTDTSYAQVVEERAPDSSDAAGNPQLQARYVWGQGLAPLAMWRKMQDGSVKLFFYATDGQESVRQLTDASGSVSDSYFYDAWGNGLAGGSGTTENPFRYTGQQRDSDGRYYLRARFYNPGNGRFLSHDPLMGSDSDPLSLHRYLYVGADGVNSTDPSGEETLFGVQMTAGIRNILISGIANAAVSAVDSAIRGDNSAGVAGNALAGFVVGAAFGRLSTAGGAVISRIMMRRILIGLGLTFMGVGIEDAIISDNPNLLAYRVTISIIAIAGMVRQPLSIARDPRDVAFATSHPNPPPANDGFARGGGPARIGNTPNQTAELAADITRARAQGATDIRVNQHQVNAEGVRVGRCRPDLQYTLPDGQRVNIEYDRTTSGRELGHETRILGNDRDSTVILKIVN